MYRIKINSRRPLKALLIAELFGDETGVVEMYPEITWLTENLPQTTGPRTERPGVEYGAEV